MYIAKKEGYAGSWDYFQDNIDDSPKWTKEKNRVVNSQLKKKQNHMQTQQVFMK